MGKGISIRWRPPGPVAMAFMASTARVQGVNGPVGSGKTSTVILKAIKLAQAQRPSTLDGVRKFKLCVVRDTYRQLWNTTIPSFFKWVPQDAGQWTGGKDGPATFTITYGLADGTRSEMIIDFVAIGEHRVEEVLRGYEPTAFYLNEADLLMPDVLTYALSRVGRYPGMMEGGPSWSGVLFDYNAPEFDGYLYQYMLEPPEGFEIFRQPGGLDPGAENLENLPGGRAYYENMIPGAPDWFVQRFVHNKPGYSRKGMPVYPEFNDGLHVSSTPLAPVKGIPLLIGADAGMTPAALITQRMPDGQWRDLDELVTPVGEAWGPTRFGEALNRLLKERYPGFGPEEIQGLADPAAQYGGDGNDKAWLDVVRGVTGLRFRPAPTNKPTLRWEAVRRPLTLLIDGNKPGTMISPRCKTWRKGFANGYRYAAIAGRPGQYNTEQADKNEFSHIHDAGQYARLGGGEFWEVLGRKKAASAGMGGRLQISAVTDDNPDGGWAPVPTEA